MNSAVGLNAHNLFLAVGVELGLVGIALLTLLITYLWIGRDKVGDAHSRFGLLGCVFAFEMTEASMLGFGNPTSIVAWLLITSIAGGNSTTSAPLAKSTSNVG